VAAGPRRHTVASGDTFPSVARLYYGSERFGTALWQFNRGRFPHPQGLRAGDLLVIPAREELDASVARDMKSPPGASPDLAPTSATTETELDLPRSPDGRRDRADQTTGHERGAADRRAAGSDPGSTPPDRRSQVAVHVVRRYETLRSIARDRLGNAQRVDELLELNRDRLADPDQLTPRQRLVLPPDARTARPGS
jgi:nucleoid-associated protein YgaU